MPSTLWYTDRSRVSDGLGFCAMARFLGYHFGPSGYGIQLKGTKLPLITGIGAHESLAPILAWCRDHDEAIVRALAVPLQEGEILCPVPEEVVRQGIAAAHAAYAQVVAARGYAYLADDENVQYVLREQQYLIEGLTWAWVLEVLPEVLRRARILEVEQDNSYVVGCTCGLGDGILGPLEHEARECQGIGWQNRPDFIAETRVTKELEYNEFKTTGMDNMTFRDKWEVMMQMFAGVLDTERRLGRPVSQIYVHGLIKGKRQGDYNPETGKADGFVRQQSVFCYGYRRPANPPMEAEDWQAEYEWYDDFEQKKRRLGNKYRKTGIWELPGVPANMSPGEYWAKAMPARARRKNLILIGPFSRQEVLVPEFLIELQGEEDRWRDRCWQLYECAESLAQQHGEDYNYFADPTYQALLHRLVPRSYECRRYGERNRCQFENICLKREGWADPIRSGMFILRRPHHADELRQAIERGLLLPEAGAGEDVEREL